MADTGIGIDRAVLSTLFSAFEQGEVRAERQHAGLGLGLAIAKRLIEAHGGQLAAHSEGRGRGSTFVIDLPGARRPSADETARADSSNSPCTDAAGGSLRALVVEDHEPTARVLRRLLTQMGCTVACASTSADAADAALRERFDVLLSDLGLPDGSGLDLMRRLREQYAGRAIALTGYTTPEDVRASHEAGFAAHVSKPVVFEQLEAAVRSVAARPAVG